MLAVALPSQPAEVSRRRLSLRHVKVLPARGMTREAANGAMPVDTIISPAAMRPASPIAVPARASGSITTEGLFQGNTAVEIEHKGEAYTLRITRQGKLILTK